MTDSVCAFVRSIRGELASVPTIRRAAATDRLRVIELCRASHAAAGFDRVDGPTGFYVPFEPSYAEELFVTHFRSSCCNLVLEVAGEVQGVLMAASRRHEFGPVVMAEETLWWIEPAHRGRSAIKMLDTYERWARERGCAYAGMKGMGDDPDVAKLYLRRGYLRAETSFLKRMVA